MSRFHHPRNRSREGNSQNYKVSLTFPQIVGYMSTDAARQYDSSLSQLKYINKIKYTNINLDLNHNIDNAVKRTTDDNIENINLLLHFLKDKGPKLHFLTPRNNIQNFIFITYRRTLISVICTAFRSSNPWRIVATVYKNAIYLCSMETDSKMVYRQNRSEQEKKYQAWGYKYEQYLCSDSPHTNPDINKPVVENEEFSLYYHSFLGTHELLYGAQIDGLLATEGNVSEPPENNYDANLEYLKQYSYIELKTNKEIQHNMKHEINFKRYKLLLCWSQCYLAGLKGVLVGFRDEDGIVHRQQWFATRDVEAYCRNEWDPGTALSYLDYVLQFIKQSFMNVVKDHNSIPEPISLQFDLDERKNIQVKEVNSDTILPEWYTNCA